MLKARMQVPINKGSSKMRRIKMIDESELKYVKIIVFDDQNRVLTVKNKSRFVLPAECIEWDDNDAEAAVPHEVFETANIALDLVRPVTSLRTTDNDQSAQNIVFAARMAGEDAGWPEQRKTNRFMNKKTFLKTYGRQSDPVHSVVTSAHRVLVPEEIKDEQAKMA